MYKDKHPQEQQQNGKHYNARQNQAMRARLGLTRLPSSSHTEAKMKRDLS
jgi:hypothetical protein